MRSGWSAGWPMRNIHWLPRTDRTLRRTWSASVWKASRGRPPPARCEMASLGPSRLRREESHRSPPRTAVAADARSRRNGIRPAAAIPGFERQMEAVDRVEKEQRAHALVKVRALGETRPAPRTARAIASPKPAGRTRPAIDCAPRVGRSNDVRSVASSCAVARSQRRALHRQQFHQAARALHRDPCPSSASASCAISKPYFTPMS